VSYATALVIKREEAFAPLLNTFIFPLTLLSGIMLPMTLGPTWLQDIAKASPFRYIIDAMREAFNGHYADATVMEGAAVAIGMMIVCVFLGARAFLRENA
jgi:ABC-2 type transport system permease protein